MKTHSLQLRSDQFMGCYQAIKRGIADSDLIKQAFIVIADNPGIPNERLTLRHIDEQVEFIAARGARPDLATLLYGMISFLDKNRVFPPNFLAETLSQQINTDDATHTLIIQDGTWNIRYNFNGAEFNFPKYDYELKEIVPESIIEIFHSVVLCLQNGLNIAALSLALVALETTLWDHLATKGIKKETVMQKYPHPVTANVQWTPGTGYQLAILDRNRNPKNPPAPVTFEVEFYRTGSITEQNDVNYRTLNAKVQDQFSLLISDDSEQVAELKESFGLSVALQRARKEGLLDWNEGLDRTFQTMRNKLIHQSSVYEDIDLYTPYANVKLGEISEKLELTLFFINRISEYISNAYYAIRMESL